MENVEMENSILWAIDPSETQLLPAKEAVSEIRHFLGGDFSQVHPVYISSEESRDAARVRVQKYLQLLDLGPTAEIEVLFSASHKRSDWVEKILNLARVQRAQCILLTSHGRSAIGALFLGSFSSELLQKSSLPILFMSPHRMPGVQKEHTREKVLFTTDFSKESKMAFKSFLQFIKGKTSEMILFHAVDFPILSMSAADVGGVSVGIPDSFVVEQRRWADHEIHAWLEEARSTSVNIHFQALVEDSLVSPAVVIQRLAERENVGLIGLTSHAGAMEKWTLGSVTQNLLSSQKFNLWVCGPAQSRGHLDTRSLNK
ncbi:MAG: universal stress protein [Pseudobdellovibrionaceae bacterium]